MLSDIYRGDTRVLKFVFKDGDGNAVPLYGKLLFFTVKLDPEVEEDEDALLQIKHVFPDDQNSLNGIGYVTITSVDSDAFPIGKVYYYVQYVDPLGGAPAIPFVKTLLASSFNVLVDVTREVE